MEELWSKNGELVSFGQWQESINSLKSETLLQEYTHIKKVLSETLVAAVKKRIPKQKFGLFLSGGLDSSTLALILKQQQADFVCYSVGFQDNNTKMAEDIVAAKKVAEHLGLELKQKVFNLKEAQEVIKNTIAILKPVKKVDIVSVGVGAVVYAAATLAKKDNINFFFGGLGSEEIFAGYQRHEKANNINEECWRGLMGMYDRDLVRDVRLAKALGFGAATPFLDADLISVAMQVPGELKIKDGIKKYILREVAKDLGLPKEFAERKKQGAQYGSAFDKAIAKLAGKMQKGEWLNSQ